MSSSQPPSGRGASGEHTERGVPHGATSLTPYVGVPDTSGAVAFYQSVFGVRVVELTRVGERVVHAHLDFGQGHLHLEEPNPNAGLAGPQPDGAPTFSLGFYCENVEEVLNRATAAGAVLLAPPVDFASGDRFAGIRDPYGIQWSIMSRVEDLSEEESTRRVAEWAAHRVEADS